MKVTLDELVQVAYKVVKTGFVTVPGIGTGAAYASGDALGTRFSFEVPLFGIIETAVLLDKDDEGIETDLVLFSDDFVDTADNSPFDVSDSDLQRFVSTITFGSFKNFASNQVSVAAALGIAYVTPSRRLWAQLVTRGTPNIAAANIPMVSLTILGGE